MNDRMDKVYEWDGSLRDVAPLEIPAPPPLVRLTEFESAVLARARSAGVRPEIGSEPVDTKGNWRAVIRNLLGDAPTRDQVVAQHLESFLANYSPPPE